MLVGARGFEPPTSSSRTTRATKLRYAPTDPVRRRVGRIADALESDPSVLENASGVTKTYYRKANASGVAKYTIALNGTWTVYATFGDEITDTVTLKK